MRMLALLVAALLSAAAAAAAKSAAAAKRNVLYIVFDDLRPDLSPYQEEGKRFMHTPHIQKLARPAAQNPLSFRVLVCAGAHS